MRWMFGVASILLLAQLAASAPAGELTFCPQGVFIDDASGAQYGPKAKWSSDFQLTVSDKPAVVFHGPIFPGYVLAKPGTQQADAATRTVTFNETCASFPAPVVKTLQQANSGVVVTIAATCDTTSLKEPLKFRILLPQNVYAGKAMRLDGKEIKLPEQKSANYILAQGGGTAEFRLPLSDNLEIGIKLLDGVAKYVVADCRHHPKPEEQFHIFIDMQKTQLKYFVALLAPGADFPAPDSSPAPVAATITKGNLLGEGSGFEVGPRNLVPYAYYSWSEAWSTPASRQPFFDNTQKRDGDYSLCIQADDIKALRGRFNMNGVFFKPVRLDPTKSYTLSAWMKTDHPQMRACLDCRENMWEGTAGNTVTVTDEWTRYSYTFTPSKYKLLNYCSAWIGLHPSIKTGTLWVDSVQLEEGSLTPYAAPELEFSAGFPTQYKLYTTSERVIAKIQLRNNEKNPVKQVAQYVVRDYWDKEVAKGTIPLQAAAGANVVTELALPALPAGYYRVTFSLGAHGPVDEGVFGIYRPVLPEGFLPEDWLFGCDAAEGNPLIRQLGFGWTRAWDFSFKRICPSKDTFNFEETDIVAERCRKAGLRIMPIIGNSFGQHPDFDSCDVPDWAIQDKRPSTLKNTHMKEVRLPTQDSWRAYVKAVVGRYKKDIRAWEVLNEPNCWITADEYVPYLQSAYSAAKEANPESLIAGGCATSDWGGQPAPWTLRVLELDQCKSMDILSIHMYTNVMPERYMDMGTPAFLERLQAGMRKYGRELPIWHTEKSHNTTVVGYTQQKYGLPPAYLKEPGFRVPDFRAKAEYLIRQNLIDACKGKGPFFWFGNMPNDLYIEARRNPFGLKHMEFDGSPCPELLAVNGLANLLIGRQQPKELIKLGETVYCAIFAGKTGQLCALWDSGGGTEIKFSKAMDTWKSYNFFGLPLERPGGMVKLSSAPVYFTSNETTVQTMKDAIRAADLAGRNFTFSGGVELTSGKPVLAAYIRNLTARTQEVQVHIKQLPEGCTTTVATAKAACAAGQYTRVEFPIGTFKPSAMPQHFSLACGDEIFTAASAAFTNSAALTSILQTTSFIEATPAPRMTIDGKLEEWDAAGLCGMALASQVKSGRDNWRNPADLSVQARFRWDQKFLYLGAFVSDDVMERNAPEQSAYASDSIEFFLGLPMPGAQATLKRDTFGASDCQILLAPAMAERGFEKATGWSVQRKSTSGIVVASSLIPGGYCLEAAIPWAAVQNTYKPAPGHVLDVSFQANDSDHKGEPADKTIYWQGNGANWQNPELWGKLVLK